MILKRKAPIKRSAIKKRPPSKAASERVYGSPQFRAHVHASGCLWCGIVRQIEQAHFGKHGMGRKNDWTSTGPLCGAWRVGNYAYVGCHARLDRRSHAQSWFTTEERHTLVLRQQKFIADWQAQQAEWL